MPGSEWKCRRHAGKWRQTSCEDVQRTNISVCFFAKAIKVEGTLSKNCWYLLYNSLRVNADTKTTAFAWATCPDLHSCRYFLASHGKSWCPTAESRIGVSVSPSVGSGMPNSFHQYSCGHTELTQNIPFHSRMIWRCRKYLRYATLYSELHWKLLDSKYLELTILHSRVLADN